LQHGAQTQKAQLSPSGIAAALAQLVRAHMEIERSKHFSIAWMMPVQFLLRGRLAR
jgi:hypothetical protein